MSIVRKQSTHVGNRIATHLSGKVGISGRNMFRQFYQSLALGGDKTLTVVGDSTGNGYDEWARRLTGSLADVLSTHYVDYHLYDNTTKAYIADALLGRDSTFATMTDDFERADGALGTTSSAGNTWNANSWTIASGRAVPNATSSSLGVTTALSSTSFKIEANIAMASSGDYRIYALNGGGRYILFTINPAYVSVNVHDGTFTQLTSMSALGTTVGQTYTLTAVKDGLKIYIEFNGRERVVELTSGQEATLASRAVSIQSVTSIVGHSWGSFKVGEITKPSDKLTVKNASVSGTGFSYHTTNIATVIDAEPDVCLISIGHNETTTPSEFIDDYSAYVTAMRSQAGSATVPVCAIAQNPQTSPAANVAAHNARIESLISRGPGFYWDLCNVYRAFNASELGLAALVDPEDGVHPVTAGNELWASVMEERMGL